MSINASAKNMAVVVAAKQHHDLHCAKGVAQHVHLAPFDVERLGWEEGDVIAGLVVVADSQMQPMRARVSCDAEGDGQNAEVEESLDLVASDSKLLEVGRQR